MGSRTSRPVPLSRPHFLGWRGPAIFLLAVALLLGTMTSPASADETRARAIVIFKEANSLRKERKFHDALNKYLEAYKLYPSHRIDLNMGLTYQNLGRDEEAAAAYQRFMWNGHTDSPKHLQELAAQRLGVLKKTLAVLKVKINIEGARVYVDGKLRQGLPRQMPYYLEPGAHLVKVVADGHFDFLSSPVLTAGKVRTIKATLQEMPRDIFKASSPSPAFLEEQRRSKTIWAWSTLGAGLACGVAAAVLYGWGVPTGQMAYEEYSDASLQPEIDHYWEQVSEAEKAVAAGHVFAGLTVVALGVSLYHFLTRPDEVGSAAAGTSSIKPGFVPRVGGGGFSLSGSF